MGIKCIYNLMNPPLPPTGEALYKYSGQLQICPVPDLVIGILHK